MGTVKLLDRPEDTADWRLRFEADIDQLIADVPADLLEQPLGEVPPAEFGWGQLLLALTKPKRR